MDAYVISLVAPHAVGVRPVVAAPGDILEIINTDYAEAAVDVDGERVAAVKPGDVVRINTIPGPVERRQPVPPLPRPPAVAGPDGAVLADHPQLRSH